MPSSFDASAVVDAVPAPMACEHVSVQHARHMVPLKGEDTVVAVTRAWPSWKPGQPSQFAEDHVATLSRSASAASRRSGLGAGGDDDSAGALCGGGGGGGAPAPGRCAGCGARLDEYHLFAVFDGHNGGALSALAAERAAGALEARLPPGVPLDAGVKGFAAWAEAVAAAAAHALLDVNEAFAARGAAAGSTATLVLVAGRLVTAANVGDSRAFLVPAAPRGGAPPPPLLELTADHRVSTHAADRARLEAAGALIAPLDARRAGPAPPGEPGVGSLRLWPGGLLLSRALGDFDVGEGVLPLPAVAQALLPRGAPARLVLASDGVWDPWDLLPRGRLAGVLRRACARTVLPRLFAGAAGAAGGLADDASAVVADLLPPGCAGFAPAARRRPAAAAAGGGDAVAAAGCFGGCFGGARRRAPPADASADASVRSAADWSCHSAAAPPADGAGAPELLARVDVAAAVGLLPPAALAATPAEQRGEGWGSPELHAELRARVEAARAAWAAASFGSGHGPWRAAPDVTVRLGRRGGGGGPSAASALLAMQVRTSAELARASAEAAEAAA